MSRAFVFPGQGSQAVGMGTDLAAAFSTARDVFAGDRGLEVGSLSSRALGFPLTATRVPTVAVFAVA